MIITIDGPVASGKSSVARALAEKLGFYYLNSGLLYRAAAYSNNKTGGDINKPDLKKIINFTYDYYDGQPRIIYNDQVITDKLHTDQISFDASQISSLKQVRDALIDVQQSLGEEYDLVTDGRDCGSVIFPDADAKFYLTADVNVRAQRLLDDPKRNKKKATLEEAIAQVRARDERDQKRDVAPLIIPQGGIVVDNSQMSQQETIQVFLDELKRKGFADFI